MDNELSNANSWRGSHEKDQRRFDGEFRISVVAELESGKPLAQIAREYGIHPGFPTGGEMNWPRIPLPQDRSAVLARPRGLRLACQKKGNLAQARAFTSRALAADPRIRWPSRTWASTSARRAAACRLSITCAAPTSTIPRTRRP